MASSNPSRPPSDETGQPAWRVALFYPEQGGWTEADYLSLEGGPLVEYDDGYVEILDMPSKEHQRIVQFLFVLLQQFVSRHQLGEVFIAPLPVRLWPRKFREPDIVFLASDRGETAGYPDGADMVIEVVSPGVENRRRDIEIKPIEYAQSGIAEYWLVDPEQRTVTAYRLNDNTYDAETYGEGETIKSARLPGLTVDTTEIFAAGQGPAPSFPAN